MKKQPRRSTILAVAAFLLFLPPSFLPAASADQWEDRGYNGGGYYDNGGGDRYGGYNGRDGNGARYDYENNRGGRAAAAAVDWITLAAAGTGGYLFGVWRTRRKAATTKGGGGPPRLRFGVDDRVLCNLGESDWKPGRIVELWFSQSPGSYVPYQILLDDGRLIMAPADHDSIIRRATAAKT